VYWLSIIDVQFFTTSILINWKYQNKASSEQQRFWAEKSVQTFFGVLSSVVFIFI